MDTLAPLIADCQSAIEDEILAVRASLQKRHLDGPIPATGKRIDRTRDGSSTYRYRFHPLDPRPAPRPDDRVRVVTPRRETLGIVTRVDRRTGAVTLQTTDWIGDEVSNAELEFDPTWLLLELSQRLDELVARPRDFHPETALRLLGRLPPRIVAAELASWPLRPGLVHPSAGWDADPPPAGGRDLTAADLAQTLGLNDPQRTALARVLGSDVQLVWGPPGTGKTRLVAAAALALSTEGRVLVTASTNAAVDEATDRIRRHMDPDALAADRLIRVGGAMHPGSLEAAVERRLAAGAGGVLRGVERLEGQLGIARQRGGAGAVGGPPPPSLRARIDRTLAIARSREDGAAARRAGQLAARVGGQLVEALEAADVVATTLTRLATREELRALRYTSVIIDEASAAQLPAAFYAASLASDRAVGVGDFRQLPPVVISESDAARRWLSRDVFQESQVIRDAGDVPASNDRMCAMLDVQYRMAPAIREVVSELFYAGRLEDGAVGEGPPGTTGVCLVDTSLLEPAAERVGGSRRNETHADVVLDWIERLSPEDRSRTIGVVSPYRAHARLIQERVRARLGRAAPPGLEVATIHRFQGRETSILVFDTVDAPPGRSWFLDERRNPDLPRLLNVALSRAQHRLVVIGHVAGLQRVLPPDALLLRLLDVLERAGERVVVRPAGPQGSGQRAGQQIMEFD